MDVVIEGYHAEQQSQQEQDGHLEMLIPRPKVPSHLPILTERKSLLYLYSTKSSRQPSHSIYSQILPQSDPQPVPRIHRHRPRPTIGNQQRAFTAMIRQVIHIVIEKVRSCQECCRRIILAISGVAPVSDALS